MESSISTRRLRPTKHIGVVSSGASSSYAPVQILKQAEKDVREESLVVIIDERDRDVKRYLGVLRNIRAHDPLLPHSHRTSVIDKPELAKIGAEVVFVNSYVRILGELVNGSLRPAVKPPAPRSYVYFVEEVKEEVEEKTKEIELNLGQGLVIGRHKYSGIEIPMSFDSLRYHVGIVGATGTGKSRLALALIKEVLEKTDWKVIVFDHSGLDYAKYLRDHVIDGNRIVLDLETIYNYMLREMDYDDREDYLYISLLAYLLLAKSGTEGASISNPSKDPGSKTSLKGQEETNKLLERVSKEMAEMGSLDEIIAKTGWSISSLAEVMGSVLKGMRARESTIMKLEAKLYLYCKRFFDSLRERKIMIRDIIEALNNKRIVVVDLSTLDQIGKRYVLKSVITKLWEIIDVTHKPINTLLVIDEAHNYACERCYDSNTVIARTAREGRKWGIGLVLVSQRIIDFETEIRNNINTFFFSKLQTPGDLTSLQGVLDLGNIGYENLAALSQREFFMAGLGNPLRYPILIEVKEIGD